MRDNSDLNFVRSLGDLEDLYMDWPADQALLAEQNKENQMASSQ